MASFSYVVSPAPAGSSTTASRGDRFSFPSSRRRQAALPVLPHRRGRSGAAGARMAQAAVPEEGVLDRPKWSGETPLSRFVGALISFKPLFSLMKLGSRQVVIRTAEKANVPWRQMAKEILESDVYKELDKVRNASLVYPDYYLKPFHAYDEGNLSWLAAAEAEAATLSIAKRTVPDAPSCEEAFRIVREKWLQTLENHLARYSPSTAVKDILDIGCSIGCSTRCLADWFPEAKLVGLDLSPYFLSVAQYKERNRDLYAGRITWLHANGEDTGLPAASFDVVSIAHVIHECPAPATRGLLKEAFRVLRPGGTLVITDNSPKSKVLQELSPVIFTLLKSTEPFLDEYYLIDLEGTMRETGFVNVTTVMTTPRHRTVTATVPTS